MSCSSAARAAVLRLRAELVGHHRRQQRALDGVREHVLAVARAELQAPERLDDLGVQALHAGLERRVLAGLLQERLELGLRLVVGLLDARRVDAPVGEQLLERDPRDLAAHAVERRQHDGAGRVVDDEVDAGEVLQRADVATLAADDAALHVVGGQLHDADGRLGGVARGQALHRDRQDRAHAPLGVALGLLLDLADLARALVAHLVGDLLHQALLGLAGAQAGDLLQRVLVLAPAARELLALGLQRARLVVELAGAAVEILGARVRRSSRRTSSSRAAGPPSAVAAGWRRARSAMAPTIAAPRISAATISSMSGVPLPLPVPRECFPAARCHRYGNRTGRASGDYRRREALPVLFRRG